MTHFLIPQENRLNETTRTDDSKTPCVDCESDTAVQKSCQDCACCHICCRCNAGEG